MTQPGTVQARCNQRLHTLNDNVMKVTEMVLLEAGWYHVDNAKGEVYKLRTLGNVMVRFAKLKKGSFFAYVATKDKSKERKQKKKKHGETTREEAQQKGGEEKKKEKGKQMRPPTAASKKPKMGEDEVVQNEAHAKGSKDHDFGEER